MATYLITGIGRGIAAALAEAALDQGHHVIGTVREASAAPVHPRLRTLVMDVADMASVRAAADSVQGAVDGLVNCAGLFGPRDQTLATLDLDSAADVMAVNVIGPLRVTQAFLPHLRRAPAPLVLMVSSGMGRMSGSAAGSVVYRASKAAVNKMAQTLHTDLAPDRIAVAACHPGWVQTDMGTAAADISARESAAGLLALLTSPATRQGGFWDWDGTARDW